MSRKKNQENSFPVEEFEEEGMVLSLSSLREAFDHVESEDDGFDWIEEKSTKRVVGAEPFVPKLAIYDGSDPDDFDDDEQEMTAAPEFEAEEEDTESLEIAAAENIELSPLSILEAMLFVGDKENRPLTAERASEFMRNVSPDEITSLVAELNERYATMNCPYEIVQEEQGVRLSLKDDFESVRTRFYGRIKEARLNQSAIDVLSIVAYRQPITADEVQKIRKQPSSAILSQLVRRDLLSLERNTQDKRRITSYRTTERFLQLFGLGSLDELPVLGDEG